MGIPDERLPNGTLADGSATPQTFEVEKETGKNDLVYSSMEGGLSSERLAACDDDGRWPPRHGSYMTATAHIVTAVIGSGVLSLGFSIAQMGWVFGPLILFAFSMVTLYTAQLLTEAYRTNNVLDGKRNLTYRAAVNAHLGRGNQVFCCIVQYANLYATGVGYTVTASISLVAVKRSICFHHFHEDPLAPCKFPQTIWMVMFGGVQIALSQIPDISSLWVLSYLATTMSIAYSCIGLGLSIGKATENGHDNYGSVWGTIPQVSEYSATWNFFVALGSIAFAYSFSMILIEIQDTLKQTPGVLEAKPMKRATQLSILITTFFYMSIGTISYAGFGDDAIPGNLLTDFGFFKPYWLVCAANAFVWVHLLGAYQVYMQPFMEMVEEVLEHFFPGIMFGRETNLPLIGRFVLSPAKIINRTIIVCTTTLIAAILPFFNDLIGAIGAIGFWPLTVHFPVEMHMVVTKVPKYSLKWYLLRTLSIICLLISLVAAIGSIVYVVNDLKHYTIFKSYAEGSAASGSS